MKVDRRAFAGFCVVLSVVGCSGGTTSNEQHTDDATESGPAILKCATTTGMVTDIVTAVAGDRAVVTGIIESGVDPHLFKPGRSDTSLLMTADVVFYSGLHLEGQMGELFESRHAKGAKIHAVTAALAESRLRQPEDFAGHPDPHVWMDVSLWSECVEEVARQLSLDDPDGAEIYQRNAAAYRAKLKELDDRVRERIGGIPAGQRILVTAHDAFEYFAAAYGVEVKSIQGISTESQAGVADINELVNFIVERKVPAIFVESSVPKKNVEAVIEGCAEQGWTLRIGGELYSDAMGRPGSPEGTYIGMIEHNARTISEALGGTP